MNTFFNDNPVVNLILVMAVWAIACLLYSALGGWRSLALHYRCTGPFRGAKSYCQTVKVGTVSYLFCVTSAVTSTRLFLSVWPPFRIGHSPLEIPYRDIVGHEVRSVLFPYVHLDIHGRVIRVSKAQADRMVEAANGGWHYTRLSEAL